MIVLAAPGLLAAATIAAWFVAAGARPAARLQLRFAAVLLAAPALCAIAIPSVAATVTLLVLPIALGVLALAAMAGFARPLPGVPAAMVLTVFSLAGLGAAMTGWTAPSLAPATLAVAGLALIFLRQFDAARAASLQGLLSALCLLGSVSAFAPGGVDAALLLFAAAGLLGVALALARSEIVVEEPAARDLRAAFAVRGRR